MRLARWVGILLLALLVAPLAQAQSATKRIGVLVLGSPAGAEPFRRGLREFGYIEGQNITVEWRFLAGKMDQLPIMAAELVALKADVLVSDGRPGVRALKQATTTIPIVMAGAGDPVGAGFVASLAHPGGTITGLSSMSPELDAKRLEIFKEAVPRVSRVASLWDAAAWGP
jgi:ABC-type uncharacterized transport system substrate-binding protein